MRDPPSFFVALTISNIPPAEAEAGSSTLRGLSNHGLRRILRLFWLSDSPATDPSHFSLI